MLPGISCAKLFPVTPQPVLSPLTTAAIFLVVTVDEGGEDVVRDVIGDIAGLQRSVGFRVPDGKLTCVVGIGSDAWDRLYDGPRPAELHPFVPLVGARHAAPATAGDLLFHLRAQQMDLCFEMATQLMIKLAGAVTVVDEVQGFKYFEMRDLMGFVDGTENPAGDDAEAAVTVTESDPDFAGGSYVIVQKYLHDMDSWNSLTTEAQEDVIGRTKLSDIEFGDDVKPSNSHVALNVIEDENGEQLQILRNNMPFGHVGAKEFGTYFIGYSATPAVTEEMLRNMFLGKPEGNHDRILDFSTAVTGTLFFVPTLDFLEDQPTRPVLSASEVAVDIADGSLGIGSLRSSFNKGVSVQ
ncbi:Dyp-type peroxidase [Rhodococcus sp. G-MC3]|uniref:Dyp-type peroxidase n=1 Tax=Rhodococcus sp. G-MC3 TaxID=3046209 RepID=UPI0024B91F95|nr:Dyp-type peroxidase [Rhodococcus sp. G-MC3]MDJ0394632.1 Dyp-type peroxidase [Rhodococcus sp. G-MC3]